MNSIKKVNLIICMTVLLGTLVLQAVPVAVAQENVLLAVIGTLMRGLEHEPDLVNLGATFVREDRTEPAYRLYSINDIQPAMVRVPPANATDGVSVAVEIWSVPADGVLPLLEKGTPGLAIGKVKLQNYTVVLGVIAEPASVVGMKDISSYNGNFRDYIARTGMELIDNATQSSNLNAEQLVDAVKQLRIEGELLYNNNQLRGSIDSLNTAVKMLGLKDRLYLNIPLGYTAP